MEENELEIIKNRIKEFFKNDFSGHDYWHTIRVYNNAMNIYKHEENVKLILVQLGALLHDVDDYKLVGKQQN